MASAKDELLCSVKRVGDSFFFLSHLFLSSTSSFPLSAKEGIRRNVVDGWNWCGLAEKERVLVHCSSVRVTGRYGMMFEISKHFPRVCERKIRSFISLKRSSSTFSFEGGGKFAVRGEWCGDGGSDFNLPSSPLCFCAAHKPLFPTISPQTLAHTHLPLIPPPLPPPPFPPSAQSVCMPCRAKTLLPLIPPDRPGDQVCFILIQPRAFTRALGA